MEKIVIALALVSLLSGCYNPINQATADRYANTCSEVEASGRLDVAEEACRRALINARVGHLGGDEESRFLYNYARIKQRLGKIEEAEELLKESLKLEGAINPPSQVRVGRRLANLSIVVGAQGRFKDAWPYLERLMPLSNLYEGQEREVLKSLFGRYAAEYLGLGMKSEAAKLQGTANSL